MFEHIIGNTKIKQTLSQMLERQEIPHALLFTGGNSQTREALAQTFGKQLTNGSSPDMHLYRPEGKLGLHSMESLRQLSTIVYYPPYKAAKKVFILQDAERMLTYSANALLKTFEEPAPHSVIILLTQDHKSLLPTVLSRCFTLQLEGSTEKAESPFKHQIIELLFQGRALSHPHLLSTLKTISDKIEAEQKTLSEELTTASTNQYGEGLTATIQHSIEKEVEGILAKRFKESAGHIFEIILSWFRDIQLLLAAGDKKLLIHKEYLPQLQQAIQRGAIVPLEQIQKEIAQAQLALDRSMPLAHCLETLFLAINRVKNN